MLKIVVQIIVPMSGFGERFLRAGYHIPKSLIEMEGKPIIAHVIDLFPFEKDMLFICNQEHLNRTDFQMEAIIRQYCPQAKIVGIAPNKLGPVHAVLKVQELIDKNGPVVINYCDFTCLWDWAHFKSFVQENGCAGAIVAYKGFHPHSLGTTNYAYLREKDGWVQDIQEKKPYTSNRMQEFASSGTYYFAQGQMMIEAFHQTIEQDLSVNGEFYVSMAYQPLFAWKKPVAVYPIDHFMQWGTPEDVAEYRSWSQVFRRLSEPENKTFVPCGSIVLPMAGLGQRFVDEGYDLPKPLIHVSGKPMVRQALASMPPAYQHVFVLRTDMPGCDDIACTLQELYPNAIIKLISHLTQGQACTALVGLKELELKGALTEPITFGACDHGMLYDGAALQRLFDDPAVDVIVFSASGHWPAIRSPKMSGWIDAQDDVVRRVSVKAPLNDPQNDPVVIGTFTFKKAQDFHRAVNRLLARDGKVNGEFYLDSCVNDAIELGLSCRLFKVDHLLSWGTPNELKTFEYWQSCFHRWSSHPYRLDLDVRVEKSGVNPSVGYAGGALRKEF